MSKKNKGLLILLCTYMVAFASGWITFHFISDQMEFYYALFIADAVATIITWLAGVIFKSASVYDPYWSVQTPVIMLSLMIGLNGMNVGSWILLFFVLLWAIRLTGNFIAGFHDISYVDWRYKMLREKTGKCFQLINLLGICMFPTVVVYLASLPAFDYIVEKHAWSAFNLIGLSVMLLGTLLEFFADIQMKQFIKTRKDRSEIIRVGLWKYSRHPNYLGEILFWYGVALVYVLPNFEQWYWFAGAVINHLMFLVISIPLAENNMKNYKSNFDAYKKEVRMLLPIKKHHVATKDVTVPSCGQ